MTRINLQVPARDVKVGDYIAGYPSQGFHDDYNLGVVKFTYANHGLVHLWLDGTPDDKPSDIRLNHADPCRITRERKDEPTPSRWDVVGPDDCDLVDVYSVVEEEISGVFTAVSRDERADLIEKLKGTV
jgi:hypothetical protein